MRKEDREAIEESLEETVGPQAWEYAHRARTEARRGAAQRRLDEMIRPSRDAA